MIKKITKKDSEIIIRGRPLTFQEPEEMQIIIEKYFKNPRLSIDMNYGQDEPDTPTITGLAYCLGFESRQSFYDYEKRPKFSYTIKRARLLIESWYERGLQGKHVTGCIFGLKNLGWFDRQDIEIKEVTDPTSEDELDQKIKELLKSNNDKS